VRELTVDSCIAESSVIFATEPERRVQDVIRKHQLQAAEGMATKGASLSNVRYIQEAFAFALE
jgi:hypothetical protein